MARTHGTTVRFNDFDFELVEAAAKAQGVSLPEYLARTARTAALRAQLAADQGSDPSLNNYFAASDAATSQLWRQDA